MSPQISYSEVAECRISADLRSIRLVLGKMRSFLTARGLRPGSWKKLELAVAEGLNNAVEHGCTGRDDETIVVRWSWQEETVSVEIMDPGNFMPGSRTADLPDNLLAEGGRGAFLMASLMDRVEHQTVDGRHMLQLTKKVGLQTWNLEDVSEMESTIESMAEDLSRSYEDLSALFRFAEELATSNTLAEFLDRSLSRLLKLVNAEDAYARFLSEDGTHLGLIRRLPTQLSWVKSNLDINAPGIETAVVRQRTAVTVEQCGILAPEDPLQIHKGAAFICPIFFRSSVLGSLVITRLPDAPYFSAGELGLIRVVADFLGIVRVTNSLQEQRSAQQRALRELEIASAIQQSLLPRSFPDNANFRIFGICQSAQEVGGDYFDALQTVDGGILLVIADVMGKGVPAALLATVLRTAIHARLDMASNPGQLLTEVNQQIASDLARIDMFITVQVAYFPPAGDAVLIANAGHCAMIHCGAQCGGLEEPQSGGVPLGVISANVYRTQRYAIQPGERLVMMTDGMYEVENTAGQPLGINNLTEQICQSLPLPLADFCTHILDFVREFSGKQNASDDRTLLVIDRLP